ncbi:hypothetical protein [Halomicronema sp. CCY15110]|uniref:hypothetical protein n=1 Tax=Halomicronema sp. CCY15110 TaxID=2767773 RepID=UPI001950682A|nr:hypothetical protein [Halomicronema sp. CCY15110]
MNSSTEIDNIALDREVIWAVSSTPRNRARLGKSREQARSHLPMVSLSHFSQRQLLPLGEMVWWQSRFGSGDRFRAGQPVAC